jgi:nitrogen fixation-related uncharacterized protein
MVIQILCNFIIVWWSIKDTQINDYKLHNILMNFDGQSNDNEIA